MYLEVKDSVFVNHTHEQLVSALQSAMHNYNSMCRSNEHQARLIDVYLKELRMLNDAMKRKTHYNRNLKAKVREQQAELRAIKETLSEMRRSFK